MAQSLKRYYLKRPNERYEEKMIQEMKGLRTLFKVLLVTEVPDNNLNIHKRMKITEKKTLVSHFSNEKGKEIDNPQTKKEMTSLLTPHT